jgi:hypothetical protein
MLEMEVLTQKLRDFESVKVSSWERALRVNMP